MYPAPILNMNHNNPKMNTARITIGGFSAWVSELVPGGSFFKLASLVNKN